MMAWVSAVVRVMAQSICGRAMRSVSAENGSGGSSPGCISSFDQAMVRPSSRGGVPVLRRPSAKPTRSSASDRPTAGASPTRPAGVCCSPIWMRPRRNVPVVSTTAPASTVRPSPSRMPETAPSRTRRSSASPSITAEVRAVPNRRLHRGRIEPPILLGPRPAHRRPLAAIEDAELDAALVGDAAHQPVERIDLADEMPLPQPTDRRIAGHGADGGEAMGDQRRPRAHARGRSRRLTAGMAAADHDDIETRVHG